MNNRITVFFILMLLPAYIFAFRWPLVDPVLITSFGENENGSFLKGIELKSTHDDVRPISEGEIIFYHDSGEGGMDIPSPLGNFTVVRHERGIFSLYGYLDSISSREETFRVSVGDILGKMGSSGASKGKYLRLEVIDGEFYQFVNPLLSLPALLDTIRPKVGNIYLEDGSGRVIVEKNMEIKAGRYKILGKVMDFTNNVGYYSPVAPFSMDLYLNGELKKNIKFESLQPLENRIVLQNEKTQFKDVYAGDWIYSFGQFDFSPGNLRLELSVKDFEGNETVKIIKMKIIEP